MTRRRALACGAAAFAGASLRCSGSWMDSLLRLGDSEAPAEVFKGGAPSEEVWALWSKRGWVREASHYLKLGANVQCKVCPNNCILEPGDRSHCRNKVNRGGTLYTMVYGNPCTFHVDPVEKKPLFHFYPGTRAFSLATSGCVFRCLNCQNWEISQKMPEETKDPSGPEFRLRPPLPSSLTYDDIARVSLFPDDVVAVSKALGCPSVAYTYSEPTAFYDYTYDTCRLAREGGLKNIVVSCGSIEERPLLDLAQFVDAAHVDLKGFDDETYRRLNSGKLEPILRTLKTYNQMGVWFEVINLIVPTYTDNLESIKRMCGWLVDNLGADRPLHFSRFHPEHKLDHLPVTPIDILVRARDAARSAGLRYVYLGNVREVADAGTTYCPNCRRPVIERDVYSVTSFQLDAGKCRFCGTPVAGVWTA
ncbi:MAG: AmmeMemoRadiSam system radical SAM enzyme [Opitutaceae bacterium]|jgi:pyruvate formate lyase activating enzyme